jgi:ABC transporter fused permease/ATP-binding protein
LVGQDIKKLSRFVRPERNRLIFGTVFLALGSIVMLTFPQIVRLTLDDALQKKDLGMIDRMGMAMLGIMLIQTAASSLRYYLFTVAGESIVKNIRLQLFHRLTSQEIGFFDGQKTGDLMSRLNSDATVLQNALSVNISMMLRNAVAAIGGLVLLAYTSPKLTAIMVTVLPIGGLMAARFGKKIRTMSKNVQEALGTASAVADETLNNIRTVRSFAAEPVEVTRFERALKVALEKTTFRIKAIAYFMSGISFVGLLGIVGVLWLGGRYVILGEMTIGTLSAYILYTMTVAVSVGTLGGLWTDFMSATGAASRIFAILDRTPEIDNVGGSLPDQIKGEIKIENLMFAYPGRPDYPVFNDLSLTINEGETLALVGASGSGKTTVAALIQRFYDPQHGRILLDGKPITSISPDWLRKQIGTVAQEPILMSTSVRENISYGLPSASLSEIKEAAKSAFADEFITRFPDGYETLVGERGVQLSGGQRQRVAIARAMLKNPRILILDEATSALDAESEHLVQQALKNLMESRTVLVIAHRLSTVRHADRIIVMDKGIIAQIGRHDDLIKDHAGVYYGLLQKQMSQ